MLRRAFSQAAKSGKKYVLTGVDGFLGGAAAKFALEIAQPNDQLVFTSYKLDALSKEQIAQWQKQGVQVEAASYNDIDQLTRVFDGAEAVSFISTWEFGGRRRQAHNVCDAAKAAGVKRVCYTSFVGADSTLPEAQMSFLPRDHRVNERIIKESGLQYSIQRDFLYQDYIALKRCDAWKFCGNRWLNNSHGVPGAYVAREDCGNALAALLLGKGEPNTIYDITGPEAVTDLEIFRWMCEQTGYNGVFTDMEDAEMRQWWVDHGMPTDQVNADYSKVPLKMCVDDLVSAGQTVSNGSMRHPSDAVEKLTGRKARDFRETLLQYKYKFPTPE